jgi:acetolactate synthase small subunit
VNTNNARHIISILVENEAGALSRVANLFSARGFNIECLTVAPIEDASLSRLTLVTSGNEDIIEQIVKQLNKLIDVVKLIDLTEGPHIERELMLIKVKANGEQRAEVLLTFRCSTGSYRGFLRWAMNRVVLTDAQGVTIWTLLVAHPRVYVGRPEACRRFLNAVLWGLRRGAPGRLLPVEWGRWHSVFQRFSRWAERGVGTDWHRQVAHDPDWQEVFLDSTIVRAHACAAGQKKYPRGGSPGALPRRLQHPDPCVDRRPG